MRKGCAAQVVTDTGETFTGRVVEGGPQPVIARSERERVQVRRDQCRSVAMPECEPELSPWQIVSSFENEISGEFRVTVAFKESPALRLHRAHRYAPLSVITIREEADRKLREAIRSVAPDDVQALRAVELFELWLRWAWIFSARGELFREFCSNHYTRDDK